MPPYLYLLGNKKAPDEAVASSGANNQIRGATLIRGTSSALFAGYEHIPGNSRMPSRHGILGSSKKGAFDRALGGPFTGSAPELSSGPHPNAPRLGPALTLPDSLYRA